MTIIYTGPVLRSDEPLAKEKWLAKTGRNIEGRRLSPREKMEVVCKVLHTSLGIYKAEFDPTTKHDILLHVRRWHRLLKDAYGEQRAAILFQIWNFVLFEEEKEWKELAREEQVDGTTA
jgi:hypothetical protein